MSQAKPWYRRKWVIRAAAVVLLLLLLLLLLLIAVPCDVAWWLFKEQDNLGLLLGIASAGLLAWVASSQWRQEQHWKRLEHVSERIRSFGETPGSVNAMMMLGSADRNIALWDHGQPECRYERTSWEDISKALIPDWPEFRYVFSPKETAIRNSLDDFFGKLAQVEIMIQKGMISQEDAEVAVTTWIERYARIPADHKSEIARSIRLYVDDRNLYQVQRLFARFRICLGRGLALDKIPARTPRDILGGSYPLSASLEKDKNIILNKIHASNWTRSTKGPGDKDENPPST